MNCQDLEFSADKSQERMLHAAKRFPTDVLNRLLAFGLHLLGAKRRGIATLLHIPEDSVKTTIRVIRRDGPEALHDRRFSSGQPRSQETDDAPGCSVLVDQEAWVVDWGVPGKELRIPATHKIQARTVLLSLCACGLLSKQDIARALGISVAHCHELLRALASADVMDVLVDKRAGQTRDYRMGTSQKAELIQQFASQAVLQLPTSSSTLTPLVNAYTESNISDRSIRWHMKKLGLPSIRKTLPLVVEEKKRLHHLDH